MSLIFTFGATVMHCDACHDAQIQITRDEVEPGEWGDQADRRLVVRAMHEGWDIDTVGMRHVCPSCVGGGS